MPTYERRTKGISYSRGPQVKFSAAESSEKSRSATEHKNEIFMPRMDVIRNQRGGLPSLPVFSSATSPGASQQPSLLGIVGSSIASAFLQPIRPTLTQPRRQVRNFGQQFGGFPVGRQIAPQTTIPEHAVLVETSQGIIFATPPPPAPGWDGDDTPPPDCDEFLTELELDAIRAGLVDDSPAVREAAVKQLAALLKRCPRTTFALLGNLKPSPQERIGVDEAKDAPCGEWRAEMNSIKKALEEPMEVDAFGQPSRAWNKLGARIRAFANWDPIWDYCFSAEILALIKSLKAAIANVDAGAGAGAMGVVQAMNALFAGQDSEDNPPPPPRPIPPPEPGSD